MIRPRWLIERDKEFVEQVEDFSILETEDAIEFLLVKVIHKLWDSMDCNIADEVLMEEDEEDFFYDISLKIEESKDLFDLAKLYKKLNQLKNKYVPYMKLDDKDYNLFCKSVNRLVGIRNCSPGEKGQI